MDPMQYLLYIEGKDAVQSRIEIIDVSDDKVPRYCREYTSQTRDSIVVE